MTIHYSEKELRSLLPSLFPSFLRNVSYPMFITKTPDGVNFFNPDPHEHGLMRGVWIIWAWGPMTWIWMGIQVTLGKLGMLICFSRDFLWRNVLFFFSSLTFQWSVGTVSKGRWPSQVRKDFLKSRTFIDNPRDFFLCRLRRENFHPPQTLLILSLIQYLNRSHQLSSDLGRHASSPRRSLWIPRTRLMRMFW